MENTDDVEDIDVREDSEELEASEFKEQGVDTADGGESKDTGFLGFGSFSESESSSTVLLIESSGSVPNRLNCSGVK